MIKGTKIKKDIFKLGFESIVKIVDDMYDEICIWDADFHLLYINKAAYRHFGIYPEKMIGKTLHELMEVENLWAPSTLPYVYKNQKVVMQVQKTFLNMSLITVTTPIFDNDGNLEYVVMLSRDGYQELTSRISPIEGIEPEDNITDYKKIICKSQIMKNVMRTAQKMAKSSASCMITGETGTGKSLLARFMHDCSDRKDEKFFALNMASINPNLIESELFGYEKGSFTGANKEGKTGIFKLADGGTIFLDEIGELPMSLQTKILHILQDGEYLSVGGSKNEKVDVRVLAATNRDLKEMVRNGQFRSDLFHRLTVFEIVLPPLREREEDLRIMIAHFLNVHNEKYNKSCTMNEQTIQWMYNYQWPGNIRELSNVIERCVVLADLEEIMPNQLPSHIFLSTNFFDSVDMESHSFEGVSDFNKAVETYKEKLINYHYKNNNSTRKLAARLNLPQTTSKRLIDKYVKDEPDSEQ